MDKRPINFYTSNPTDGGFRSLATLLNQEQPVRLRDISELPAPDRRRPTRQQLLTQRAGVVHELAACQEMITLGKPHPRLAADVLNLEIEAAGYEHRLQQLDAALGQEGGQDNG